MPHALALLSPIAGTLRFSPPLHRHPPLPTLVPPPRLPACFSPGISARRSRPPRPRLPLSAGGHGPDLPSAGGPAAEEAREAVVEVLQEFGASAEDSVKISSRSPKYIEMLVENVWELDEHSLWNSWGAEAQEKELGSLSFKRKVYYMAKRKGDGGILPLLESIGLKHSSAMVIARYLSSERLPEIIEKVKFVKEILFSRCDHKELVGRNARRMMAHLSISIDEDVQKTLSFFEKMEAGHGRLNMLGHEDASFPYLIESFPRILLCSMDHMKSLVDFLEVVGVPKERIGIILLAFPPIIYFDIETYIRPRMHALKKAGVEGREFGRMLLKYPWILSTSIQENYENILTFFNEKKVPKSSVDLAIRGWPHLLGCSTRKMKGIVDQFDELGVNRKMLVPVITSSPQLLLKKPNELLEVVSFMEDIGFDVRTTGKILCRCPEIFAASVENTLRKKVKFLTDFGISRERISRVIRKYPELFLLDMNNTLLPRMRYFMEIGLSQREVCSMLCRFSPLLGYSIDVVLKPKLEFLLRTMGKPLKEIVEYPRYFSYSLDKRIKPRFWVLKSRNLNCSLKDMLGKNNEEFAAEYMGIGRMLVPPSPVPPSPGPPNDGS